MKNRKKLIYISTGIGVFTMVVIGFFIFFNGFPHRKNGKTKKTSIIQKEEFENKNGIEYSFFYPSMDGNYLVGVKKKIKKEDDLSKQIKEVVKELFKGPDKKIKSIYNPFSANLKLNEFYLIENSIVVVDVNENIFDNLLGGSDDEILTIYSIVDTISYNFPFVKATQIIINGREAETLAGHIDISHPLRFDPKWIKIQE